MDGLSFVTPVTGLSRPNTGNDDDDDKCAVSSLQFSLIVSAFLHPCRQQQYIPPKCWYSTYLQVYITIQKTTINISIIHCFKSKFFHYEVQASAYTHKFAIHNM
jgi:hypothetical protein